MLVREGKLSPYSACAEFYGGPPDKIQEDVQRRLNIDWTSTASLDMESILQEVNAMENAKLERQRFLHSTHFTHSEATLIPTPSSESKREAYVAPAPQKEIRPAPAPKETSPQMDSLTSLIERMSISMAEIANNNMRIDEVIAQVSKMSLEMANLNGPKPHSNPAQQYGQNQQYGQSQRYGPNLGPSYGPNQGGQFNNSRQYPGPPPPNRQYTPRNYSNACSVCGEEGHWRNDCATLSDLIQKGIVHIKDDRNVYLGRTGDRMVNRQGD